MPHEFYNKKGGSMKGRKAGKGSRVVKSPAKEQGASLSSGRKIKASR
mgnify:CR=1 FL=1